MTANHTAQTAWLTVADVAEVIDESVTRVRRMLDEHYLIGSRRDGTFRIPEIFLVDAKPLSSLRGTIIVLQDAGFTDDEVVDWLLNHDDTLGRPPIEALLDGHKSAVRRVARILA